MPEKLIEALAHAKHVGVITGAGISAESGIPTYRGIGGVYDDPAQGEDIIDALSGPTLARDPDRTWRAVGELARHATGARPNAGHAALVEIEKHVERFVLLTQNVDGLHQAAGSRNVIAVHGSIRATRCMECGKKGGLTEDELRALDAAGKAVSPRTSCAPSTERRVATIAAGYCDPTRCCSVRCLPRTSCSACTRSSRSLRRKCCS